MNKTADVKAQELPEIDLKLTIKIENFKMPVYHKNKPLYPNRCNLQPQGWEKDWFCQFFALYLVFFEKIKNC